MTETVVSRCRRLLNRSLWCKMLWLVADDLWWGLRLGTGRLSTKSGTIHSGFSLDESVRYVEQVYEGYRRFAGVERFQGVAAEVGPGDSAGVGLLLRGHGCRRVDLIDRYQPRSDPEQQARIYAALAGRHDLSSLGSAGGNGSPLSGIEWRGGRSAEAYFQTLADRGERIYDFIGSWAVLEHLYDPLGALENMVACLRPGGRMVHVVDLRDHGMFSSCHPELEFLRFPGWLYRLMTRNSGRPNRVLVHAYREVLDRPRANEIVEYRISVTSLVGAGMIEPWAEFEETDPVLRARARELIRRDRNRLAKEFRTVRDDDLAVSGVVLAVHAVAP